MSDEPTKTEKPLTIAIPTAEGRLAMHFGHCQEFAIFEVDTATKKNHRPAPNDASRA